MQQWVIGPFGCLTSEFDISHWTSQHLTLVRAVIQRVSGARVIIGEKEYSRIAKGLLVLLGVEKDDTAEDAEMLARRIVELRIFEDDAGKMNRSILEAGGEILVVSQFTL